MKRYVGSTYIGVVGGDLEYGVCRDSITKMLRNPDDAAPRYVRATKGYEARQMHLNSFIESKHDYLLMLDHDMIYAPETLERLRGHGLPYVTGAYMRRQFEPVMAPVWFDYNPRGLWPHQPATTVPDKLTKVGASGWGCILVHREVILAVRDILKGEAEVIEDDMDIWPYDLERLMRLKKMVREAVEADERAVELRLWALNEVDEVLAEEIRPLRGTNDPVGSDIRFPFFARAAGFPLWLDPEVTPGHVLHYPLRPDDFLGAGDGYRSEVRKQNRKRVREGRKAWRQRIAALERAE
jgi:hypothetical protein